VQIGGRVSSVEAPSGDGLAALDEAPLEAVDFAPRALRPPSHRAPLAALGWVSALLALVGVGLFAGRPVPAPAAIEALAAASPPAFGWPTEARTFRTVVNLDSPAPAQVEITSRRLAVKGTMLIDAERVLIALEARGNRVLEHAWVDVFDPDGGIRPAQTPRFGATFDLPNPRPNATMWVVVTAFDEGGMPLGAIRQPFSVGPLLSPGPWDGPVPVGPPWCIPASPTLATSC
jgi:hypothetical protein